MGMIATLPNRIQAGSNLSFFIFHVVIGNNVEKKSADDHSGHDIKAFEARKFVSDESFEFVNDTCMSRLGS